MIYSPGSAAALSAERRSVLLGGPIDQVFNRRAGRGAERWFEDDAFDHIAGQ
jgi:hypothetical protein